MRYIAFLRGINVSGYKIIKMEALNQYFVLLGYANVVTYIQSGNVLFDTSETDTEKLRTQIEEHLQNQLGYLVSVILRTIPEIKEVIRLNPFINLPEDDTRKLSVVFLSGLPTQEKIMLLPSKSGEQDELCMIGKEVYILYQAYNNSKLSNAFFEKKLSQIATTRNWATINKIIGL